MKQLHVHISVEDIAQSVKFYSPLFTAETFLTSGESTVYGVDLGPIRTAQDACCTPKVEATPVAACCGPKADVNV